MFKSVVNHEESHSSEHHEESNQIKGFQVSHLVVDSQKIQKLLRSLEVTVKFRSTIELCPVVPENRCHWSVPGVFHETKLEDPTEEYIRVFFGNDHTTEQHNAWEADCSEEEGTLQRREQVRLIVRL